MVIPRQCSVTNCGTCQQNNDIRLNQGSQWSTSNITLEAIYSGLSKSNFKDHYGDTAK